MSDQIRRFDYFLEEMLDAMHRILSYTNDSTYEDFIANSMLRDAVIRNFEIMGESAKHVPYGFQKLHKNIPWKKMFSLRNFIVHEFFDVDDEILWAIIQVDLKRNASDLKSLIHS